MSRNFSRFLLFSCVLIFISFFLFGCSKNTVKVYQNPKEYTILHAEGKTIKNALGSEVRLRGTNAGSYLVTESWMSPIESTCHKEAYDALCERFGYENARALFDIYESNWWTESDFDNIKNVGFNVIRLPFTYMNLTDPDGKFYEPGFARLADFVKQCRRRELYVILDLHGAIGSQSGYEHSGDVTRAELFSTPEYMDATVTLWKEVASRFVGNEAVAGYDLLNEPLSGYQKGGTGKTQWDFYDRLYGAIRSVDPTHMIFLEGIWGAHALPSPEEYGWENVVYEFHNYQWSGEKMPLVQKNAAEKYVRSYADLGVPVLIGEFNAFSEEKSWRYVLNAYEKGGCNWTTWSYKICTETLDDNNMWGLYCGALPKINPHEDSYDEIAEVWSRTRTENFVLNEKAAAIFADYCK